MTQQITLDTCAQEPIHIPGAIQPHGVLLLCEESSLTLKAVSASIGEHLHIEPQRALGADVRALFDESSVACLVGALVETTLRTVNPLYLVAGNGRQFEAVLHRPSSHPGHVVIELEPARQAAAAERRTFDPGLRSAIVRLQTATDLASLSNIAADEIRKITGYDRVMVYRFDADWNGEVIAEARNESVEPFLGQRYPASDIPAQARRLYELNWLRIISDVAYVPSPMVGIDATSAPLDMSHAVLRSVSPIHIEYLHNMGVTASMSFSLVTDGKLRGLIACHHYAGVHYLPFAVRETAEYLAQALSWHSAAFERAFVNESIARVQEQEAEIVRLLATSDELMTGLATPALQKLVAASAAAVVLAEGFRCVGDCPPHEAFEKIVAFLKTQKEDIFFCDKLSDYLPEASAWEQTCAGVLAVTISRELGEYLLWFRPPTERVINWAGNPYLKKIMTEGTDGAHRLSPRGSFALWREVVSGKVTALATLGGSRCVELAPHALGRRTPTCDGAPRKERTASRGRSRQRQLYCHGEPRASHTAQLHRWLGATASRRHIIRTAENTCA